MGQGKGDPPPPPDYTPFIQASQVAAASSAEAAAAQERVGMRQLDLMDKYAGKASDVANRQLEIEEEARNLGKQQYNDLFPYLTRYLQEQEDFQGAATANQQEQTAAAALSRKQAGETYDRYVGTYAPREDQFLREAYDYATPARQDQAAAEARGDVATAFNAQREKATRQLQSYGIDPSEGAFQGIAASMGINEAAAGAAAGTLARKAAEQTGKQYELAALQVGQKLPTQAIGLGTLGVSQAGSGLAGGGVGGGGIGGYNQASSVAPGGGTGSPTGYAALTNPYTSLSGAYGSSAGGLYGNQASLLGSVPQAIGAGVGALNNSFNNQMSIYQAQQKQQSDLFGGIGKIAGAVLPFVL